MSGPLGSSQWMYSSGFYPTVIDQSLMFDGTSYLSRTPSAGDRKTWTWSGWVKRSALGVTSYIASAYYATSNGRYNLIRFNSDDQLNVWTNAYNIVTATTQQNTTTAVFRDTSAWYHIVIAFDSTNATASSRLIMYVNGVSQEYTGSAIALNQDTFWNGSDSTHIIGNFNTGYLDGYLADTYFVDGTVLDATSFGEFKNGVWIPKAYTGSYGTNGFHLEYNDNANDSSGTGNNWTATNIVAGDYMLDSPTNNYCTLNPLVEFGLDTNVTYSEGNLKAVSTGTVGDWTRGTIGFTSGKYYFETTWTTTNSGNGVGIDNLTSGNVSYINQQGVALNLSGSVASGFTNGDIIGTAINADDGLATFYKNDVAILTNSSLTGWTAGDTLIPRIGNQTYTFTVDFGQSGFTYTPPAGFLALSTANLPEPSISPLYGASPQDHFNTVLWTGDGNDDRSITGVGFQPDFTWIKRREAAASHLLHNSVIGANSYLNSDTTDLEDTNADGLQLFESDGFQVGASSSWNGLTRTYVAWNWKASNAASVLNEAGSIPSQVSANTTAGFSIVSYTGNVTDGATVGHGLGVAPNMFIVKDRDSASEIGKFIIPPLVQTLALDLNENYSESAGPWSNTAPTSTVFTLGGGVAVNNTNNYIAYCFHSRRLQQVRQLHWQWIG
jgi:hypothetical protein